MKKFLFALLTTTMLVACSNGDKTTVINNSDRVALLEARADLNDAKDSLLEARVTSLESRMDAVEGGLSSLQTDVSNYQAATDSALADLAATDQQLASDIADANAAILDLQSTASGLQSQVDSLSSRVSALETRLQGVEGSYPTLAARLNAMKNSLNSLGSTVSSLVVFQLLQTAQNIWVQNQIHALDQRIAANTSDISSLTSDVQALTSQVSSINASTQAQIANLQDQITNIQLTPGPKGDKGDTGSTGATGPAGQNGTNGTTVTPIQLCTGDTASYPEQGLVINGATYAVYYGVVNGTLQAFLSKLSPANYTTTDGGSCAFTIGSNGLVSSTPAVVIPAGATHELLLCGIVSYKVPGGVVVNGTTYTSNTTLSVASGSCTITNPNSNSVSSNGQSGLGGAQSCNYNGIPSYSSTTPVYQTGASSNLCYIKHL